MISKIILFISLSFNLIHISVGQQCDTSGLRRFDTNFAKLLTLGSSGRQFPENKQDQLKKYCNQSFEYIQEIDKYRNRCLKQMSKQVTGVVVYSVKNAINQYCKRDSKKLNELITSFTCANRAKLEFDQCYTNLIDAYQGIINADEKKRIPHICCEYYKLFGCLKERASKKKDCTEGKVETASNFIKELFANVNDMICTDYVEGSDKCDNLGPPAKKKRGQRRSKSFMLPLMDILSSLPEL